jgi:hypothetical protein
MRHQRIVSADRSQANVIPVAIVPSCGVQVLRAAMLESPLSVAVLPTLSPGTKPSARVPVDIPGLWLGLAYERAFRAG